MLDYNQITIDDKHLFDALFKKSNIPSCNYSFATIYCWQHKYRSSFALLNDGCVVVRFLCDDGKPCYMPPLGHGNLLHCIEAMENDAKERGDIFRIGAATPQIITELEAVKPDHFQYTEYRELSEYIYLCESLSTLKGKNLQPKRNHVNKFTALYPNYRFEYLNKDNIQQCRTLYGLWHESYIASNPNDDLSDESCSISVAFDNFEALGLSGISLWVDDVMVAFAFGEMLTDDTFLVHVEKALVKYQGAYSVINKLTALHLASNAKYINREEDMELEHLRRSKMSYYPEMLLSVGSITLK